MFNVGGGEMLAILLLALLVLGPERLPKAMGEVGKWVGQLRRMSAGFQDELKKAMDAAQAGFDGDGSDDADGDKPFTSGQEARPALPPGIEEEVRVVHSAPTAGDAPAPTPVAEEAVDPVTEAEPVAEAEEPPLPAQADEPSDGDASVTPLRPRRDDETRATG
jgi:sec-independent protein translocase protein TatB